MGWIEQDARLVPDLYQAIRNRVGVRLLRKINEILHGAEAAPSPLLIDEAKEFVQQICNEVSDVFQCFETSVFLEDPLDAPGQYQMFGTTWPGPFDKTAYSKDENRRTSWVLKHGQEVKIFDLANLARDREIIQREYPGLPCNAPGDFIARTRQLLGLKDEDELQPLSFMAAPIMVGKKSFGAIRCCAAKQAPYYFASRELVLLTMAASRLSQFWSAWIRQSEIRDENRSWQALVESIGEMNSFVHHELSQRSPSEIKIFEKGLQLTKAVIRGAEIMDVCLRDPQTNELYFAAKQGEEWRTGTPEEIRARSERRFPLDTDTPSCVGARVFKTREASLIEDVSQDPDYAGVLPVSSE